MITNVYTPENQAKNEYQKALKQAFWRKARQWLGRGCNDLLSFDEVYLFLRERPHRKLGIQMVLLAQIVGSSGRHRNFDLAFNPIQESGKERWINVAKAKHKGIKLPPVLLYKVGDAYFVEDGNHRVSIARASGEISIQAKVIEIDVSDLIPDPACTRLGYKFNGKHTCENNSV